MVHKEMIVLVRYPINFVASFGQVFLIVAVFVLGGSTFFRHQPEQAISGADKTLNEVTGLVVYGRILFLFLSDTLWTIG